MKWWLSVQKLRLTLNKQLNAELNKINKKLEERKKELAKKKKPSLKIVNTGAIN